MFTFGGSQTFRTMIPNHLENLGHHIRILGLVQNARNVEHAVLEELDGDLLFILKSVSAGQKDQCHRVMSESRVLLGLLGLDPPTNLVP